MKMMACILLITTVAGLTGCNKADTSRQTKTIGWLFEHRDELAVTLKLCRDNPGELATMPNCINAVKARNKFTVQEMKDALK